jgi:excisionase family DNA binding protein
MKKEKICIGVIIILSLALITGSLIITYSINKLSSELITYNKTEKNIMNIKEASQYLGVSSLTLEKIIERENLEFPYLKVEGNYIFTKEGIDAWLATNHIDLD